MTDFTCPRFSTDSPVFVMNDYECLRRPRGSFPHWIPFFLPGNNHLRDGLGVRLRHFQSQTVTR